MVNFGKPLSMRDYLAQVSAPSTDDLADILMGRIAGAVPILPIPAISTCLLAHPHSREELIVAISTMLKTEPQADIGLSSENLHEEVDLALEQLLGRNLITLQGTQFTPTPDRIDILRYYANSIAHLLAADAAAAQ